MELNNNGVFSCNGELTKNTYGDTTLRLECFGCGGSISGGFGSARSNPGDMVTSSDAPEDGCRLILGLGPTPSTYSNNSSKSLVPVVDEGWHCENEDVSATFEHSVSTQNLFQTKQLLKQGTKSRFSPFQLSSEPSALTDYSISTVSGVSSDRGTINPKKCKFEGCSKVARGATGRCIGHGGGQRCQRPGCNKGGESRTVYCKAHGGGKRCQHLGCTKSAEGKTEFCIAHGGGRRCEHKDGCTKAARGKSGLCIKHGGGKRCKVEGCTRSAEGQIGLCISHGGGRRCHFSGCIKGAQGSTLYCKAHGGGKRCVFAGCRKGAEGSTPLCKGHGGGKRCLYDGGGICPKSVHGGTKFCVSHGGGKRCSVQGCGKSARGRTDCCVKHGGGKRCMVENCGKSAQGSTEFCKAHGGGKRCNWGDGKCEKFARGKSGQCAAHGSLIAHGLCHGLVSSSLTVTSTYSSSGVSVVSDSIDSIENPGKRQCLVPPQVLVPPWMRSSLHYSSSGKQGAERSIGGGGGGEEGVRKGFDFVITEGRVHGGGLLSFLGGNLNNAIDGI